MNDIYDVTNAALPWIQNILHERFGHEFSLRYTASQTVKLYPAGSTSAIEIDMDLHQFTRTDSDLPFCTWDAYAEGWTAPLGQPLPAPGIDTPPSPLIEQTKTGYRIHYDILGLTYWMLSRQEEVGRTDLDNHGRFPATASHAYKHGYLERPIVDEWLEILWAVMKRLWPSLERKQNQPQTLVSCDVDRPYVRGSGTVKGTIQLMREELMIRRSPQSALQHLVSSLRVCRGDYSHDPHLKAIDWIMEVNERVGNRVAFYFIADHSHPTLDGCYHLDEPVIRDLIRRIHERGHEIGLHASYNTYRDAAQTNREADRLRRVLEEEGIQQDAIGGRQHYLRWETPITARNWEIAGMAYDSTLCYADRPGFRCGTCHEYPMYDVIERQPLKLRQRPLIVMECSVIADCYLGLGYSEKALDTMLTLKNRCHQFGGNFTLLWHNSHFNHPKDREFYKTLIA